MTISNEMQKYDLQTLLPWTTNKEKEKLETQFNLNMAKFLCSQLRRSYFGQEKKFSHSFRISAYLFSTYLLVYLNTFMSPMKAYRTFLCLIFTM